MWIRGVATGTLDGGRCPPWLFERMKTFCRLYFPLSVAEIGVRETLKRLADPIWFQSFGSLVGFDWNASGLTTTLTAAIKESLQSLERDLGWTLCGGKGKRALQTPREIQQKTERLAWCSPEPLIQISRLTAKIDNALIQDGFSLYHHTILFSRDGFWVVIQQGMNPERKRARRYHWAYLDSFPQKALSDPHSGIISDEISSRVLNLSASASEKNRQIAIEWLHHPRNVVRDLQILERVARRQAQAPHPRVRWVRHARVSGPSLFTWMEMDAYEYRWHPVVEESFWNSPYLRRILMRLTADPPRSYLELILRIGVGPQTLRALALVGELLYGAPASYQDPCRYSFAHGGKDGTPYPVNRKVYDETLSIMRKVLVRIRSDREFRKQLSRRLLLWEDRLFSGKLRSGNHFPVDGV